MDQGLYVAMSGAQQILYAQAINSNNLANVHTTGFRADLVNIESAAGESTDPSQIYALSGVPVSDFTPGPIIHTNRSLDVAIRDKGWLVVQDANGNEAYTRAGDLRLLSSGQLVNGQNNPLMGSGGPIAIPPAESIEIAQDGTISIRARGSRANEVSAIDQLKLVNPDVSQLVKGNDGLFRLEDGSNAAVDSSVQLVSGSLETSNVNAVDALTQMISLSRQFEVQIKVMKAMEENDQLASRLMQIS